MSVQLINSSVWLEWVPTYSQNLSNALQSLLPEWLGFCFKLRSAALEINEIGWSFKQVCVYKEKQIIFDNREIASISCGHGNDDQFSFWLVVQSDDMKRGNVWFHCNNATIV